MAIAIKNTPVLKDIVAETFDNNAKKAVYKKSSIDFSKQVEISSGILEKAKF